MPTLDEAAGIVCVPRLRWRRFRWPGVPRWIVVDGGSGDGDGGELAAPLADRVIAAARGRAGADERRRGPWPRATRCFSSMLTRAFPTVRTGSCSKASPPRAAAGAGSTSGIEGRGALLPVIAALMNLRSRLTGIATGDQAIFARRAAFERAAAFPRSP